MSNDCYDEYIKKFGDNQKSSEIILELLKENPMILREIPETIEEKEVSCNKNKSMDILPLFYIRYESRYNYLTGKKELIHIIEDFDINKIYYKDRNISL